MNCFSLVNVKAVVPSGMTAFHFRQVIKRMQAKKRVLISFDNSHAGIFSEKRIAVKLLEVIDSVYLIYLSYEKRNSSWSVRGYDGMCGGVDTR